MMDFSSLEQALELSRKMLQLAEASDWEQVNRLDDERRHLLELGLVGQASEADRPRARGILEQIERLNGQTLDRLSQGKAELFDSIQLFRHRQDAALAYMACEQDSLSDGE